MEGFLKRLIILGACCALSGPAWAQGFSITKKDQNIFVISADEPYLAVEKGYSRFGCKAKILQNTKSEYLDYAKKKRAIYEFPLIVEVKEQPPSQCVWWVRPCTHQECYFPSQYMIDFETVSIQKLSKPAEPPTQNNIGQPIGGMIDRWVNWVQKWTLVLGLLLGFLAGINPCNLPLIPLILHYSRSRQAMWWVTSGAFVTIWALMMLLVKGGKFFGQTGLMQALGNWVHLIFAVLLIGFGFWAIKGSFDRLQNWITSQTEALPKKHVGAFLWGVVFAFLSIPCVGPVLALYGVVLFNADRGYVISSLGFALGFVSWFFLWSVLGRHLRQVTQKAFKIFEVSVGILFLVLGIWRGVVFVQGFSVDAAPYVRVTPQLESEVLRWSGLQKLHEIPYQPDNVYFLSAPWCVECQPYVKPLKRVAENHSIVFINIDELSDQAVNELRKLGILGVPTFVFIRGNDIFFSHSVDIQTLESIF